MKQTRPVRDRSNIMHNFVALAEENDWLRGYDVDAVNAELAAKRAAHAELVERGEFWEMDAAAREAVSPETHQVQCAPRCNPVAVLCCSETLKGTIELTCRAGWAVGRGEPARRGAVVLHLDEQGGHPDQRLPGD